jgi:hypothetical protein
MYVKGTFRALVAEAYEPGAEMYISYGSHHHTAHFLETFVAPVPLLFVTLFEIANVNIAHRNEIHIYYGFHNHTVALATRYTSTTALTTTRLPFL